MTTLYQCTACRKELMSLGKPCVNMFDDACEYFFSHRMLIYKSHSSEPEDLILHYLEKSGYVESLDFGKNLIAVKPINFCEYENGDVYICRLVEEHL